MIRCPECMAVCSVDSWDEVTKGYYGNRIINLYNAVVNNEMEKRFKCPACGTWSSVDRMGKEILRGAIAEDSNCEMVGGEAKRTAREKLYSLETCIFRRAMESDWEPGLLLNDGNGRILDEYGEIPLGVWDYRRVSVMKKDLTAVFKEMREICIENGAVKTYEAVDKVIGAMMKRDDLREMWNKLDVGDKDKIKEELKDIISGK